MLDQKCLLAGYDTLRPLSYDSQVYLCRERASNRLLILKIFSERKEHSFLNEARILSQLQKTAFAPNIYFAYQKENVFYLGQEYIQWDKLSDLRNSLNLQQKKQISQTLKNTLSILHQNFLITHGDISPANILVNGQDVLFLDWECAECIQKQNIDSYKEYKGTVGFNEIQNQELVMRDQSALQACIDFLEPTTLKEDAPQARVPSYMQLIKKTVGSFYGSKQ